MINKGIVDNVEASFIETYLNKKGFKKTEEERGIPVETWVNSLIETQQIEIDDFESFLFQELFMGKRKLIVCGIIFIRFVHMNILKI